MSQENSEHQLDLKNPFIAAFLGYLVPGAGHLYQGRYFKGLVYFVCIVGIFCFGMRMAEGKAVFFKKGADVDKGFTNLGFIAQAGVGTPALAAIFQWKRFTAKTNQEENRLTTPLNQPFNGKLILKDGFDNQQMKGLLVGTISLKPVAQNPHFVEGTFKGTVGDQKDVTLKIDGTIKLQRAVNGNSRRSITCDVADVEKKENEVGELKIKGTIPRPLYNSFVAPLEHDDLQDVRRRLGNKYDLAVIFTWIAGLLNVLAVWDAFEGPAYGYDDKVFQNTDQPEEKKPTPVEPTPPNIPAETTITKSPG